MQRHRTVDQPESPELPARLAKHQAEASDFLREVHKNVRLYWTDNTEIEQAMLRFARRTHREKTDEEMRALVERGPFTADEALRAGQIIRRLRDRGKQWWADPFKNRPGEVNTNDGGRGVYWSDPVAFGLV